HRRGRGRLGPGARRLRHARHLPRQEAALREELHAGRHLGEGRDRSVREGGQGEVVPRRGALVLAWTSSIPSPTFASDWLPNDPSRWSPPWATCTPATSRSWTSRASADAASPRRYS